MPKTLDEAVELKSVEDVEMEKKQDEYLYVKDKISKIDVSKAKDVEELKLIIQDLVKIILR